MRAVIFVAVILSLVSGLHEIPCGTCLEKRQLVDAYKCKIAGNKHAATRCASSYSTYCKFFGSRCARLLFLQPEHRTNANREKCQLYTKQFTKGKCKLSSPQMVCVKYCVLSNNPNACKYYDISTTCINYAAYIAALKSSKAVGEISALDYGPGDKDDDFNGDDFNGDDFNDDDFNDGFIDYLEDDFDGKDFDENFGFEDYGFGDNDDEPEEGPLNDDEPKSQPPGYNVPFNGYQMQISQTVFYGIMAIVILLITNLSCLCYVNCYKKGCGNKKIRYSTVDMVASSDDDMVHGIQVK